MNRKQLHETEMHLALLFDNGTLTRNDIIESFTDLMQKVTE